MKFSARIFILLISLVLGFLFFSSPKILAADPFQPGYQDLVEEDKKLSCTGNDCSVASLNTKGLDATNTVYQFSKMIFCPDKSVCPNPDATSSLIKVMAMTYDYPPASAIAYTYDLLHNAGLLTKPVYAQGIGFAGLSPLLPLWKASRNVAYAILIVVMLAIGFMIIFRMKIDPKTVISVQSAIPKIIFTLILITFSYPIAGFFIDLMYLFIFILVEVVTKAIPDNLVGWSQYMKDTPNLQQAFIQTGLPGFANLFTSVFSFGLIPAIWDQFFKGSVTNIGLEAGGGVGIGLFLIRSLSMVVGLVPFLIGFAAIPLILLFLIGLGLLFTFIRLFFLLMNSYIQLIITVILGPIFLLKEAIPGQSAFGDYVKNLMANLVVFPATIAIIMFSQIITAVMLKSNLWGAPLIPVGGGGDVGGSGNPLSLFIGMGIIFLAPSLVASIKKAFGAKAIVPVTAGTAFSPLTGAVSTGMGAMQSFYYFQQPFVSGAFSGLAQKLGISKGPAEPKPSSHTK